MEETKIMANQQNGVPTFTPPTQTFTPPSDAAHNNNGPVCYYHNDEPAVAQCVRCGKFICKDCFDTYQVTDGEYNGQALCYDCCQAIVADNVVQLKKNKRSILVHFIATLVGMVLLPIYGAFTGLYADTGSVGEAILLVLLVALLGGSLWPYFKTVCVSTYTAFKKGGIWAGLIGFFLYLFIGMFIAMFRTFKNVITYSIYLKKTSGFIESDSQALQNMKDYMEYTLVRSQNKGVDLETLMGEDSALANNSFAQMVREEGEDAAEANVRNCVASINENGEIIRNFAA